MPNENKHKAAEAKVIVFTIFIFIMLPLACIMIKCYGNCMIECYLIMILSPDTVWWVIFVGC